MCCLQCVRRLAFHQFYLLFKWQWSQVRFLFSKRLFCNGWSPCLLILVLVLLMWMWLLLIFSSHKPLKAPIQTLRMLLPPSSPNYIVKYIIIPFSIRVTFSWDLLFWISSILLTYLIFKRSPFARLLNPLLMTILFSPFIKVVKITIMVMVMAMAMMEGEEKKRGLFQSQLQLFFLSVNQAIFPMM